MGKERINKRGLIISGSDYSNYLKATRGSNKKTRSYLPNVVRAYKDKEIIATTQELEYTTRYSKRSIKGGRPRIKVNKYHKTGTLHTFSSVEDLQKYVEKEAKYLSPEYKKNITNLYRENIKTALTKMGVQHSNPTYQEIVNLIDQFDDEKLDYIFSHTENIQLGYIYIQSANDLEEMLENMLYAIEQEAINYDMRNWG